MIDQSEPAPAADRGSGAWARVIAMEAINNFRDYGDVPAAQGRVRKGLLFRSAHHARATAGDAATLSRLGVRTVTDLRGPTEQRDQPSTWRGTLAVRVIEELADAGEESQEAPHHAALREGDFSAKAMRDYLEAHYAEMPYDDRHVQLFRTYFAALAEEPGGMLIHCAAGKDRTGILAWLTHHLLGVHADDAMEDYLLSNDAANIAERLPLVRARMEQTYGRPIAEEAMLGMLQVRPEFIANCLRALDARSGSVDAYLRDVVGVDQARAEAIRARLIA